MNFEDMPTRISVTFTEVDGSPLGRIRKYRDDSKLYDILKAASAGLETRQAVEYALAQRRPGRVTLNLTPDQYHRLKFGR